MQQLIYHKASIEQIQQQAITDGMSTLVQYGILKVLSGVNDFKQLRLFQYLQTKASSAALVFKYLPDF